jgi:HPt (histidine-containing phosphotransfer) domain-containing protein
MTAFAPGPAETNLFVLRARFLSLLPQRIDAMAHGLASEEPLSDLARRFHNLAGIAGTYGLADVGTLAGEGEETCETATGYDDETKAYLRFLIDSMRDASAREGNEDARRSGAAAADAVQAARFRPADTPRVLCTSRRPSSASIPI